MTNIFSINQDIKNAICCGAEIEVDTKRMQLEFCTVNKKQKALLISVLGLGALALATAFVPYLLAHQSWVQMPSLLTKVNWLRGGCALGGGVLLALGGVYAIKLSYDRYQFKKLILQDIKDRTLMLNAGLLLAFERNNAYQPTQSILMYKQGITVTHGFKKQKEDSFSTHWAKFQKLSNQKKDNSFLGQDWC